MINVEEKERKLTIVTRYVSEEMITDFHNHDLTLEAFIRDSNSNNKDLDGYGEYQDIPIKIYIPEQEEDN